MSDICDFCDNPAVVCRYDCLDFASESKTAGVLFGPSRQDPDLRPVNAVLNSRNYWAACVECARFVDAEDIGGLEKRVLKIFDEQPMAPLARIGFAVHLHHTYQLFFKHRIRVSK